MSCIIEWVSAVATAITAIGVVFAFQQLRVSKKIAQAQFEDGLAKEYRDLASSIPTKALLGEILSETEYADSFDEMYRYVDLTNEQVSLRQRGRITKNVWWFWLSGIKSNLRLPAFYRAWTEIKSKTDSFAELRRLEGENFETDPYKWKPCIEEGKTIS